MKKAALVIVTLLILATTIYQFTSNKTFRIGAILTLTGPAQNAGKDVLDGINLAADFLNKRGGINGHKIEIFVADSESKPEKAVAAYHKIRHQKSPLVYISTTSDMAAALAPVMESNKDLLFALVATSQELTIGKEWIYKFFTTPETETDPIIRALHNIQAKKVGVLYLDNDYGKPLFELLESQLADSGVEIKAKSYTVNDPLDDSLLSHFQEVDSIYIVGYQSHISKIVDFIRNKYTDVNIFICNSADIEFVRKYKNLQDVYTVAPLLYDDNYPFASALQEEYFLKYGKYANHFVANGYDFVNMFASAMEDQELTPESIKMTFDSGFSYPGVLGDLYVRKNSHNIAIPLEFAKIVNGKIIFLAGRFE